MTRSELDDAIRKACGWPSYASPVPTDRMIFLAGMRASADIAADNDHEGMAVDAIRRAADELSR